MTKDYTIQIGSSSSKKKKQQNETIYAKGGRPVSGGALLSWIKRIPTNWSPEQIKDLQIKLGVEPTGKYDEATAEKHIAYFGIEGKYGLPIAQNTLQQNVGVYNKDETTWQKANIERQKLAIQRQQITKDMYNLYTQYLGAPPTRGSVNDIANKVEDGWGFTDFDRAWRSNPEFKKAHPGITDNVSIQDYESLKDSVYTNFINNRGRPPQPHEIADVLQGRKLKPIGGMGQTPNFNINTNLGGI